MEIPFFQYVVGLRNRKQASGQYLITKGKQNGYFSYSLRIF